MGHPADHPDEGNSEKVNDPRDIRSDRQTDPREGIRCSK